MANFTDLIGAFMQNSMGPSSGNRIGSALEQLQRSGFGGIGGGMGGAQPSAPSGVQPGAGPGGLLGSLFEAVQGGLSSAAQSPGQAGGLGAVLGSLLGGGKGAVQGGMLAVIASVAMKALQSAGQDATGGAGAGGGMPMGLPVGGAAGPWSGGDVPVGMRMPRNTAEQEALESTAQLVLKGMINAAKSDGQISPDEMQRIVGKLQESGADQGMQQWVLQQMQEPLERAGICRGDSEPGGCRAGLRGLVARHRSRHRRRAAIPASVCPGHQLAPAGRWADPPDPRRDRLADGIPEGIQCAWMRRVLDAWVHEHSLWERPAAAIWPHGQPLS